MSDRLAALGWDAGWADRFAEAGIDEGWPARVTAQHRDRWILHSERGSYGARIVGTPPGDRRPVTGDWVVCKEGPQESDPLSILAVLPRRSAVKRGSAGELEYEQVLAANLDVLWLVQSLETGLNLRSLERYLAVAWDSGATPEIVLTKADLAQDVEGAMEQVNAIAFGTSAAVVSVRDPSSLATLRDRLSPGRTIGLLGPSGAGKSTLINHLAGSDVAQTGEVRSGDGKGRHTTTTRELFPIHGGALLLDTPGMRELKVLDLETGLEKAFPEIDELSEQCRFRDCTHASEPGCAVLAALEDGQLDPDRLESYRKLEAEAAYQRRRIDPQAQAEHVGEWKTIMKSFKHHPKYRDRR